MHCSSTARATALLAIVALVLTACGTQRAGTAGVGQSRAETGPASGPASEPPAASRAPGALCPLPRVADPGTLAPLPPSWRPTSVVICDLASRTYPGEGEWEVQLEKRAVDGLDALVTAMRAPDEPTSGNSPCPAIGYLLPAFAFVDGSGAVLQAAVPRTGCGQPQPDVMAALGSLTYATTTQTRVRQVRTQERVDLDAAAERLGCSPAFKDMIAIEETDAADRLGPGGSPYPTAPRSLTLCRYVPDPTDPQVGLFESGERLTGARLAAVLAALDDTAPGATCASTHRGFAALTSAANDGYVLVERGGCGRVYADPVVDAESHYRFGQSAPALLDVVR
jgi:hypothetical protein